jgi:hypothetical protein
LNASHNASPAEHSSLSCSVVEEPTTFTKSSERFNTAFKHSMRRRPSPANDILCISGAAIMSKVYFNLAGGNLSQNWSNTGLITGSDDWSNVPSFEGFLGQDIPPRLEQTPARCSRTPRLPTIST